MDLDIKYRGKVATLEDLVFIKKLIEQNPDASRRALSVKLCEAWNWVQTNGALRDMVCRGFMLELHRRGYICLPPKRCSPKNPLAKRQKPVVVDIDEALFTGTLRQLKPLEFRQVRRSESEPLFNSLLEQYHYLGYTQPVGEHLKYIVFADQRPIACLSWSSAPRHIGCRDRYIGWSPSARKENIHLIAYNSRFLILPWVRVAHLASHILGSMARRLSDDWYQVYRHPVFFLETFVDTEKFLGTCYKAANWVFLGKTTGRGKDDQTNKPNRSIKAVWGYPLHKRFKELLCEIESCPKR